MLQSKILETVTELFKYLQQLALLKSQPHFDGVELLLASLTEQKFQEGTVPHFPFLLRVFIFFFCLFKGFTRDTLIKNLLRLAEKMFSKKDFRKVLRPPANVDTKLGRCLIIAVFQTDFLWLTKTMKSVPLKDLSYTVMSEYPDLYAIFWDSLCSICLHHKHGNTSCSHNLLLLPFFYPFPHPLIRASEAVNITVPL